MQVTRVMVLLVTIWVCVPTIMVAVTHWPLVAKVSAFLFVAVSVLPVIQAMARDPAAVYNHREPAAACVVTLTAVMALVRYWYMVFRKL